MKTRTRTTTTKPIKRKPKNKSSDYQNNDQASDEPDSDHLDSESEFEQNHNQKRSKTSASKSTKAQLDSSQVVSAGIIAPSTMNFLKELAIPENNDRDWLAANDKNYRISLKNWNSFVEYLSPKMIQLDWTLPVLPAKDLVHRIYRDVRFSNDKTPYKTNFSAGFSRTGKKGPWAGYYIHIKPGDRSVIAGGVWNPEKQELTAIRKAILQDSSQLRNVINNPEFVSMFGPPEIGKGKDTRQSIFGHDDALKNCPKMDGVDKSHPDIDLLKLKSMATVRYFPDALVLSDRFVDEIEKTVKVLSPLIQCLNEMIMPQSDDEDESSSSSSL
ncbi:hypothetical protein CROQUDRAFT_651531 [Cronartium quercuum f. sp. fusiforme G11]|uniref:DUF2461 domain-containing protein n=1 Tax=Cronartium quercuum f. sp. fusiforme G11 TaxID=708437 RepID=A0A9P6NPM8_9BASI|nr:hypothetical protein CROQUDRAFT_651531 [Cronartium quercuum f. sp. fusiforme G11]